MEENELIYLDELFTENHRPVMTKEEMEDLFYQMQNGVHSDHDYKACLMSADW